MTLQVVLLQEMIYDHAGRLQIDGCQHVQGLIISDQVNDCIYHQLTQEFRTLLPQSHDPEVLFHVQLQSSSILGVELVFAEVVEQLRVCENIHNVVLSLVLIILIWAQFQFQLYHQSQGKDILWFDNELSQLYVVALISVQVVQFL